MGAVICSLCGKVIYVDAISNSNVIERPCEACERRKSDRWRAEEKRREEERQYPDNKYSGN